MLDYIYTGIPTGAKEFKYLVNKVKDAVNYPEITEEEFEKLLEKATVGYGNPLPHRTKSLCPESRQVVPAVVWEKDGKVWITKKCPEGLITELYYEDVKTYERFRKWLFKAKVLENYHVDKSGANCPFDCGLCKRHYSHTCLLNIVVTNRCNLSCWYCLPEDEEILVRKNGEVRLLKFKDLARDCRFDHEVEVNGVRGKFAFVDGLEVLSFKDFKAVWCKVEKVFKRFYKGKIVRITTKSGRVLRVTPEHGIFICQNRSLFKKEAGKLRVGDKILSLMRFNVNGNVRSLNLLKEFRVLPAKEKKMTFVRGVNVNTRLSKRYGSIVYSWRERRSIPLNVFYEIDLDGSYELGRDATRYTIPSNFVITPEFSKLVGYFISDGHYTNKDIRITVGKKDAERELFEIVHKLNLPYSVLKANGKTKQLVVGSRLIRLLLKYVLGIPEGAKNKRLPRIFLDLPLELRLSLLSGLLNGDGYVVKGKRHLSIGYASVSRDLIRDLLYLLASLGVFARVHKVEKEKVKGANHDLYKLYVGGEDLVKLVSLVDLREKHLDRLKTLGKNRHTRIEKVGDYIVDEVAKVEFEDYEGYVYDLQVKSEHHSFVVSDGILVSNCFFYAKEGQPIYEPTLDQIRLMLRRAKEEIPPCNAVQLTGGEPTLRDDLVEIIRIAKEEGYDHVQLNTDGIRLAFDRDFVKAITEAGVNTIYLSFDGITPITNWKNHWEIPLIFKNIRELNGPGIVLVPTLIRNINDSELGAIINFGLNHIDIVRGVNFQPISMVGRVPKEERSMFRVTIPRALKLIEEQTNGAIAMEDWYPVPIAGHIARFFDAFLGKRYYMTSHFACGCATYVFLDDGKVIPITRFIDVEGFVEYLVEKAEEMKGKSVGRFKRLKISADLIVNFLKKFYDESKAPKELKVLNLMKNAFIHGDYEALGEFHKNALFLGMMHFQDEYNYDVERTERCVIHYGMPDGRIVPFCAFNVIPEFYRDKIQPEYSYSWEEWKKKHPDWSYKKDKYVRTKEFIEEMMKSEIYRKTYEVKNYFE
ncbi:tetraether lipid synthase Tes, intein-containing [Archaeoglobus profundus]|uniref:Radical SAM domain protein n=1 Tax=Archaeoglobus profundus (strain DSM 5631 / JCM 9629 / NBRC 100127 / Av18) TaxID=572546 RepID=D2RDB2_ARCPA|nr:radical SAM protein [Archaeoglobus profundus]ADB58106.1 Radical SAM domain protein [Archaeoglobus profundus DSM 5631]